MKLMYVPRAAKFMLLFAQLAQHLSGQCACTGKGSAKGHAASNAALCCSAHCLSVAVATLSQCIAAMRCLKADPATVLCNV